MGRIYKKGASEIDQCAHRIYDAVSFRNDDTWTKTEKRCFVCGNPLETYYCEERLYIVRCHKCTIEAVHDDNVPFMLIKAKSPDDAAKTYNRRDKLVDCHKKMRKDVLSDALRHSEDLEESCIDSYISCQGYGDIDCRYDGGNDHTPCIECKCEWLKGEWDE